MELLHIAFFGPVNSGKSTLINEICGQEVSLVSAEPGTTTDPVRKRIELPLLGPCVLIDTAGLGDESVLGAERERRTRAVLDETDVAVLLLSQNQGQRSQKSGKNATAVPENGTVVALLEKAGIPSITYTRGESVESLLERIAAVAPMTQERFLTGNLVKASDVVVLVMPQDSEAPKGRLILPQVQVLRELLDRGCTPVCCTPETLESTLGSLKSMPDLVITDSQAFGKVAEIVPKDCPLTSFSVLLAAAKGDIRVYIDGAAAIDTLNNSSRVLIAEACSHVPASEDIGRVKIPSLLRKRCGEGLKVDIAAGNDFPENLQQYDLIIHCGACVATRTLVRNRIKKALLAGVPITNYGIAIAHLKGILKRISLP